MISYLKSHPNDFDEAIQLAISDKQPYSWRAAWLIWSCIEKNDQRIKKYIDDIINALTGKNDNQIRELFIILQKMQIDETHEGVLFNFCVDVWKKINKKPSVRFNAFKLIIKIAQNHPDLTNEVSCLIQNQYTESLSLTVKKSINKMIKEIN